ncbi:formate dehydrogenase subunit gamma [Trichlorobacter thiogenes]|uniref:Formate dehydrogenase subunit gamma n=1 Tax=Trichlorobacter thiogenes TaxID=115783 RepID=A0A1T4PLV2_9BACT|nr:cytochrome b/b6 domain-containing protein [Trichlorobacter thiogenes]SJZ92543.1 formate dehydrogenase subunit gamma [Trichlorobacter thiogenes]
MVKNETITVKRHSFLYRMLHWLIVAEVLLLLLSGLGVSDYLPFGVMSRGAGRSLHIVLGLGWMGTITFFVYNFVMSGEYNWFGVSKIGNAFDFFVHEIRCLVGGKKIENPVGYEVDEKRYVEKIMATEVLAWWGWLALWIAMAVTGLALLFPESFSITNRLCHWLLPAFKHATAATRVIHMVLSMVIVVYIMIHAYASWAFGMVGSMISGNKDERIIASKK